MSAQTVSFVPLVVEDRFYGDRKPQLAVPDNNGKPKKLKLELRKLAIEEEFVKMRLPRDERELMKFAICQRQQTIENKYNLVLFWIKVQQKGDGFWRKFHCASADELLVRLDLPVGETLARWELLVRLVEKETFLLVGDDALGHMIYYVSFYQLNVAERRKDYAAILEGYPKKFTAFDRSSFKQFVNEYVNKKYALETSHDGKNASKRPKAGARGRRYYREVSPRAVVSERDVTVQPETVFREGICVGCRDRDLIIDTLKRHVIQLEEIIRTNLGPKKVPARPKTLDVAAA